MFDPDAFEERAAILEYEAGLSRFAAETGAAAMQSISRWEALQEVKRAKHRGDFTRGGDNRQAGERDAAGDMPGVQPRQAQQDGPVPERDVQAGRGGLALLALRPLGRGVP